MLQLKNSLMVCAIVLGTALGIKANTVPVDPPAPVPGPCAAAGATFDKLEHTNMHGGCTIGDKTFSDFTFTSSATGGAHKVDASHLDYSIINRGTAAIGFSFSGPIDAGSHQTNEISIGYVVTDESGPSIIDAQAAFTHFSAGLPFGSGTITETICPGGRAVIGCSTPLSLHVAQPSATGSATITFSPDDEVAVSKTVLASAPPGSFFNITGFSQTFSQVPEPGTMLLFGTGLLLIGTLGRKLLHA